MFLRPPYSVVRRSQVTEERPEWAEWSKMIGPESRKKGGMDYKGNLI